MTDLKSNTEKAWSAKRPLFQRLSEGTCWLVSLPYPDNADKPEGRHWYHILLDSWIWGEVGEYGGWVVGQRFHGPAKYNSIEEIQDICREVEKISHATSGETPGPCAGFDAVVITHLSIDHLVPHVLREIPSSTPCFVSAIASDRVEKLGHFDTVTTFGTHDPTNWRACQVEGMPSWISLGLLDPVADIKSQTPAVIISFESGPRVSAVIYALHGIEPEELEPIIKHGELEILGFMAGLTATKLVFGPRIAFGATKTVACLRSLSPRWWIRNHDDEFVDTYGLVGRMLRMDVYDLERALKEEAETAGTGIKGLGDIKQADLRAGEYVALV